MMDELMPWIIRASTISQYVGASMSMICDPMSITWPETKGQVLILYRSENMAIGTVAACGVSPRLLTGQSDATQGYGSWLT